MIESLCYRISSEEGEATGEEGEEQEMWDLLGGNWQTKEKRQVLPPLALCHQGDSIS